MNFVKVPLLALFLTTGLAKAPAAPQNTGQAKKTVTAPGKAGRPLPVGPSGYFIAVLIIAVLIIALLTITLLIITFLTQFEF